MVDAADISTLSIVFQDFAGPLRWMADDLAVAITDSGILRVLPVMGVGDNEIVRDVLHLKSMDLAFVHSDLLDNLKRRGAHSDIENRLRYVARLYAKDVGLIAGRSITSIRDLAGRKVNFDHTTSGNLATSMSIFERLGIKVEAVQFTQAVALEKIKSGEIAATVLVDDKPNKTIATLRSEDGFRLLPIELTDALRDVYAPSQFSDTDYPGLIAPGTRVNSVSVSVVMAIYDWPPKSGRYGRVARFVEMFFPKFPEFQLPPRHPNWKKVDIAAALPGWTRFQPAEDWLLRSKQPASGQGAMANLRVMFHKFLELQSAGAGKSLTPDETKALFHMFLAWKENPDKAAIEIRVTAIDGVGKSIGVISAENTETLVNGKPEVGLLLKPKLSGLRSGRHVFLIHSNPNCGPEKRNGAMVIGLGAGDPLPFATQDGVADRAQSGLPQIAVAADGTASTPIIVPGLTMSDLLDRSIMIYAATHPTSVRIACGIIN